MNAADTVFRADVQMVLNAMIEQAERQAAAHRRRLSSPSSNRLHILAKAQAETLRIVRDALAKIPSAGAEVGAD